MMLKQQLVVGSGFRRLVERNAPLWGGEAEVIRSYFDAPHRNAASDRLWVLRQMYKEYWDGIMPPLAALQRMLPQLESGASRAQLLELTEVLHEEVEHYSLFAELHDRLRAADEPAPDPETLQREGAWPENDSLMAVRARHRNEHGALGHRAYQFTEGGYCTLFSEGMKLEGRGGIDDLIARVCSRIYQDEFEHMLLGITGIDDTSLSEADWGLLCEMTVEQLQYRIRMRNAQFGFPVPETRIAELLAGAAEPIAFDYALAEILRGSSTGR
jgi:hypothetical protein